jgi:hypothetical protein
MDIKIKIPRSIVRAWDKFCDWGNEPIGGWRFRGRGILWLDLVNAVGLILTIVWGYISMGGWFGALAAFLSYVLVAMCALWLF